MTPFELRYKEDCIITNMKLNGIGKKFLSSNLQDFQSFKYDVNKSYYLYGSTGIGKTRLLCAIGRFNSTIKKVNLSWKFISAPKLLFDIRQCYTKKSNTISETELVNTYSTIDLLLLDDLGAEKTTEWTLQTLYLILNNRYENELLTIISSNYPYEELCLSIGNRISSRIAEMCEIVELQGKDRRIK